MYTHLSAVSVFNVSSLEYVKNRSDEETFKGTCAFTIIDVLTDLHHLAARLMLAMLQRTVI